jgi:DNA-binding CsgD family transcriptional regulator
MFSKSLSLYRSVNDSLNIAGTLTNIATVHSRRSAFDSAFVYNKRAEVIFQQLKNPKGLVTVYNNLASVCQATNRLEECFQYLTKAYAIAKERGFFDSQVSTLLGLGDLKLSLAQYESAKKYFSEAQEIAASRYASKLVEVYKGLSDSERGMKNYDAALHYYDRYVSLKDSVFSKENAMLMSNLRVSHELEQKNAEIVLLEKDNKIAKLSRNLIVFAGIAILIILALLIVTLYQKMRKNRESMIQQKALHDAREAVAQSELEIRKAREEELNRQLEFRNRALTTYTLNLVQKNGMLDEVREIAQEVLKEPQRKESELKKLVKLVDYSFTLDKDWEGFKTYFEQVHPEFFKKLKFNYPDLSATELRLCALIRLSLSIKESASILSISPDSVKVSRHRVRKKLGLTTDDNLTEFINSI